MSRHGGKLLVDQLVVHGADTVFSVPGESFLAVLDGLYDSPIRLITCRHEAGAANMADAYGKLTGRPGHRRRHARPGRDARVGRRAHRVPGLDADDPARRAGRLGSGRARGVPGDRLPADVRADGEVGRADRPRRPHPRVRRARVRDGVRRDGRGRSCSRCRRTCSPARPMRRTRSRSTSCSRIPGAEQIDELRAMLEQARAAVRDHRRRAAGRRARRDDMRTFLEANALPAGAAFRRQDAIDNDSPSYVGDVGIGINPKLAARVRDADLLLVVGPRLGEMTTSGYTLVEPPTPAQTLVHVHPGAEELGRVYRAELADPLRDGAVRGRGARPARRAALAATGRAAARADYEAWQTARPDARHARPRRVHRAAARARAGRDRHERRRQLLGVGAPLLALARVPDAARADERRDGLRRAGGGRSEGRCARSGR